MQPIGNLQVKLSADIAEYTKNMARSAEQTEAAMARVQAGVGLAKKAIVALGVAGVAYSFAGAVHGAVEYADRLNDLSKSTSLAIETLDGLQLVASQSGTDLGGLADSINKLSVNIGKEGAKYRALGISAKDPIEAFKQLSDIFVSIEDPQKRAALAAAALGKSWSSAAPALAEGGKNIGEMIEKGHRLSGVTKEMAANADKFNDALAEMKLLSGAMSRTFAKELLVPLAAISKAMAETYEESGKLHAAWVGLGGLGALIFTEEFASDTRKMKLLNEELERLNKNKKQNAEIAATPFGKLRAFKPDTSVIDTQISDTEAQIEVLRKKMADAAKPPTPATPPGNGKNGKDKVDAFLNQGDDATKARMEGQLRVISDAYAKERDVAAFNEKFMAGLHDQRIVDEQTFEAFKKASLESGLDAATRAYDAEIKVLQTYRAAAEKETDKAEATNKIKEKMAAKEKARIDASQDSALLELENQKKLFDIAQKGEDIWRNANAQQEQEIGGIIQSLETAAAAEVRVYTERIQALENFKEGELGAGESWNALIEEEQRRHSEVMSGMQLASGQQLLGIAQSSADQLYSALKDAGLEQTALGKAMFAAQKAIQIASIIVNTEVAAAAAQAGMIAAAGQTAAVSGPAGPGILAAGVAAGAAYATVVRALGYATAGIVAGTAIAGAREKGGPVWAGADFLVGEKGPEIFRPSTAGTIIPNHQIGGGAPKITLINTGTQQRVKQVQRVSREEWALIVEDSVDAVNAAVADPNSKTSRVMRDSFSIQRART